MTLCEISTRIKTKNTIVYYDRFVPTSETFATRRGVRPRWRGENGDTTRGGCGARACALASTVYVRYTYLYAVSEIPYGAEVTRPGIPGRRRRDIINETDFVPFSRGIPGTVFTVVGHASEWRTRNSAAERDASIARRLPPRRTDHGNARARDNITAPGISPDFRTAAMALGRRRGPRVFRSPPTAVPVTAAEW